MIIQSNINLSTYAWRSIQENDIPSIKAITAAAVEVDQSEGPATEERLTQIIQMLGEKIETNSLAGVDADASQECEIHQLRRPHRSFSAGLYPGTVPRIEAVPV